MRKDLSQFIEFPYLIKSSLEHHKDNYRVLDPGWYLYRQLMLKKNLKDKLSKNGIELMYVTLCAWNMNSRGAKLSEWNVFSKSLLEYESTFESLQKFNLNTISSENFNDALKNEIKEIYKNVKLVSDNKPKLITYSKTLHFLYPNLIGPIDRKYTLKYFYNNTSVPKNIDEQYEMFCEIQQEYRRLSQAIDLSGYLDESWNQNIPKIVDNIIIGYEKENG